MSTNVIPASPDKSPAPSGSRSTPAPLNSPPTVEGLDPEEDVAPNLGGEDQMQDA